MILDNRALLSDKQAIVATAVSTDHYDLGAMGSTYDGVTLVRDLGKGKIPFMCQVTEDFDALTSLTIEFQTSVDSAFTIPITMFSVSVLAAALVEGYQLPIDQIPRNMTNRYFRMNYTVVGANPTVGQISAGVVAAVN